MVRIPVEIIRGVLSLAGLILEWLVTRKDLGRKYPY